MRTKEQPFIEFGRQLRDARRAARMTQAQLAKRLRVGQQAVSSWERGTSRPETRVLALALAELFPEHDSEEWLRVTGYRPARVKTGSAGGEKAVRPLLEALPLERLSFQQFQGFSALLLKLLRGDRATVHEFGVEGDAQDGIDIDVRLKDGRYEVYQCKREKRFGPEKVRRAVRALKVKCDRAFILLSRPATVAARKALPKSGKWVLWDTLDIARTIRTLPMAKQKRIVDTYFRAYRKDFLGIAEAGAFESPEEHFAPLLRRDHVFSHAWTLAGRGDELTKLLALVERPPRDVTLLVGSGGIGKSRIVLGLAEAYAAQRPNEGIFVLPSGRVPSASDFDILADQPALLIIEDAHDHPQLGTLLASLARLPSSVRLLVVTRPYAAQFVRAEASKHGLHADDPGTVTLGALTLDQAETVAREILKDRSGPAQLAGTIARLTRGSSFALVVGSYLVATARIHPSALNNVQQFRDELFGRFRDALTGGVGPEGEHQAIRDTLDLIALLQPVDPEAPAVATLAEQILRMRPDKAKRAIQLLTHAGVLIRRGRLLRIVPDLLAEYVLEGALLANGASSGFAERVIPLCDEKHLANVLLNVSKLDWRLTEGDESQAHVADAVWRHVETLFNEQGSAQDTVIEAVARAAYYQPQRALAFYDRLRARNLRHDELSILLKHAAMTVEHVEAAASRLWELGKDDQRALNQYPSHPIRVLRELAEIAPGKPAEYCERVVQWAIGMINARKDPFGENSLFGVLEAALATEGHTTESQGHSIAMTAFTVRRQGVAAMRRTAIDFLLQALEAPDRRMATRAACALEHALRGPHGLLGRVVTDEERASWAPEFVETLRQVRSVVEHVELEPFVLVQLQRTVNWHAHFAGPPTAGEAKAVLAAIPKTLPYRVSLVMADPWGHLARVRGGDVRAAMDAWHQEQKRVASDLVASFPDTEALLAFLRERLDVLQSIQGATRANPGMFVQLLAEAHAPLARAVCEAAISDPNDRFRSVLGESLYKLAIADPTCALTLANAALAMGDTSLEHTVSWAYGLKLANTGGADAGERALVERLIRHPDPNVALGVIRGVSAQVKSDPAWALATLLKAPIDRSSQVADEVCATFTADGDSTFESLDESTVIATLERLGACPSIDRHWVQEFLVAASLRVPLPVVQLLTKRIDVDAGDHTHTFQALPYAWEDKQTLRFRETADFPVHLKLVREWLLSAPKSGAVHFWGGKLYAAIAGSYDEVVLADLDEWTRSGDEKKLAVVARVLSAAPSHFVFEHRDFVVILLERAADVSEDALNRMRASLWGSAVSGGRHGVPGRPFPEDEAQRTDSGDALSKLSRSSPAWDLYESLRRDAEGDIKRKLDEDEELFEQ
jgi:transcriptional regulator with XRE-family HTH domain